MLDLFWAGSHQKPRKSGLLNRYTADRQLTEHLVGLSLNLTTKKVGYLKVAEYRIECVGFYKSLSNKGKVV